ncbi:hypothetical protein [Streptomyces triticirhizae]|uniref:Peptidoglycan-binding protein n=1 Tax=Streptomyces triticirhizae TaxID=2483353 RepID=A0A3M2M5F9_9ACTN|nr:hypothetical protein [Streptomyces triticirhizae]RMI44816.1 hypothetical protein EBN88_04340 [Streptomyces triticirhizae]
MADEMVRAAQRFINTVYSDVSGIPRLEEDGQTGWDVMFALTRALQYELGITALSDNFGPGTLAALQEQYPVINPMDTRENLNRIVQSAALLQGL